MLATPLLYLGARLVLDEKTRTVRWVVPENNHAVDFAWRHPMGKAFENALRKVRWVRGTGGKLVGNDEYNRDSRYEGGGANYVTRRYGPLGQA